MKELGKVKDREEKLKRKLEEMDTLKKSMHDSDELSVKRLEENHSLQKGSSRSIRQHPHRQRCQQLHAAQGSSQ